MPENNEIFKRFQQLLGQSTLDVFKNIGPPIETINVDITTFSKWGEGKELPKEYPLAVGTEYKDGLNGGLWFVFSIGAVDRIARAFLEKGLKELGKITQDCVDAVTEVTNQITGSLNTRMEKLVSSEINISSQKKATLPDILKAIDSNYLASKCEVIIMELNEKRKESIVVLGDERFINSIKNNLVLATERKGEKTVKESPNQASSESGSQKENNQSDKPETYNKRNIDLILDINLDVAIRVGSKIMLLNDILELSSGTVIELDRSISDPVDVIVNNKMIARGEIVVVEGNYGIKITEIATKMDRIRSLA